MTGKVIDSDNNGILLLLLPLALITMLLFVAWPFIVAIFLFSLGYKLWQRYRLQQLSEQIDPYFNKLIETNQGSLTILDITNQTELNAKTARLYLDSKAEEYGAVKRLYEDKTIVYYFLTANALGSIFDDSEPPQSDQDENSASSTATSKLNPSSSPTITKMVESQNIATETEVTTNNEPQEQKQKQEQEKTPATVEDSPNSTKSTKKLTLNQTELAKRLEVSPSTIAKRKLDRDFGLWCQSRDPKGFPWEYIEENKEFVCFQ